MHQDATTAHMLVEIRLNTLFGTYCSMSIAEMDTKPECAEAHLTRSLKTAHSKRLGVREEEACIY